MIKKHILLLPILFCELAKGAPSSIISKKRIEPEIRQFQNQQFYQNNKESSIQTPSPKKHSNIIEMDEQSLLANPKVLELAMSSVLSNQDIEGISAILPVYRKLKNAKDTLINYGEALLAHKNQKLEKAIRHYRQVIANDPKISIARFNLAIALYQNHQNSAARSQLIRLQSENLPKHITKTIRYIVSKIDHQEDWAFDLNFYYQKDDNINGALTETRGPWQKDEPQKAHGIHFSLGAKKQFNITDNIYSDLQLNTDNDIYWDAHHYDFLSFKAGAGVGYQNAKFNIELQPFIQQNHIAASSKKREKSLSKGISVNLDYRFSQKWKATGYGLWSYNNFERRKYLSGNRYFFSLAAQYTANPLQYWQAGIHYYNSQSKGKDDSYNRKGVFISWGQEWPKGFSSNLSLSISKRNHEGIGILNTIRKDKNYSTRLSLWHRGLHYWGITPRLVLSWNKTNSNYFFYDNKETETSIEFSKSF